MRLADQASWSGGFFLFNLALATSLPIADYAAVTVASSMGLIVTACVRSFAVDGRVISGARASISNAESLLPNLAWLAAAIGGAIAAGVAWIWIALSPEASLDPAAPLLAFALVAADTPHYLLTIGRRYLSSGAVAFLYLFLGAVALLCGVYFDAEIPVWGWIVAAGICSSLGLVLSRKLGDPTASLSFPYLSISWRMSAEALYSALGGQLGILIIFLVSDPSVTVGLRLAYSLVFAPVFMVIQGLTPLYLGRMSDTYRNSGSGTERLALLWVGASWLGLCVAAALGYGLVGAGFFAGTALVTTIPFLAPVGMSMAGNLALDSALLAIRFSTPSKYPHRIRLASVAIELALQLCGILVAGVPGLVAALIVGGALKIAVGGGVLSIAHRVQTRTVRDQSGPRERHKDK